MRSRAGDLLRLSRAGRRAAARRDPLVDQLFEYRERHRTVVDDRRVEVLDVEARAERAFRAGAKLLHLAIAQQVAERLRWRREIPVDLALGESLVDAALMAHEVDRLVARPVEGVNSRIDDQTRGAKEARLEVAVVLVRILVEAQVVAERLGVQRPALGIRDVEARLRTPRVEA